MSRALTSYPLAITAIVSIIAVLTVSLTILDTMFRVSREVVSIKGNSFIEDIDYTIYKEDLYILSSSNKIYYEIILYPNNTIETIALNTTPYSKGFLHGPVKIPCNPSASIAVVDGESLEVVDVIETMDIASNLVYSSNSVKPPSLYMNILENNLETIDQFVKGSYVFQEYRPFKDNVFTTYLEPGTSYLIDFNGVIYRDGYVKPIPLLNDTIEINYEMFSENVSRILSNGSRVYGRYSVLYNISLKTQLVDNKTIGFESFSDTGWAIPGTLYRVVEEHTIYNGLVQHYGLYSLLYDLNHTIDYILIHGFKTGKLYCVPLNVTYSIELLNQTSVIEVENWTIEINSSLIPTFPLYRERLNKSIDAILSTGNEAILKLEVTYDIPIPYVSDIFYINISAHINDPLKEGSVEMIYGGLVRLKLDNSSLIDYRLYSNSSIIVNSTIEYPSPNYTLSIIISGSSRQDLLYNGSILLDVLGMGDINRVEYMSPDIILELEPFLVINSIISVNGYSIVYGNISDNTIWIYSEDSRVYINYTIPPAIRLNNTYISVDDVAYILSDIASNISTVVVGDKVFHGSSVYVQNMYCLEETVFREPVLVVETSVPIEVVVEHIDSSIVESVFYRSGSLELEDKLVSRISVYLVNNVSIIYRSCRVGKFFIYYNGGLEVGVLDNSIVYVMGYPVARIVFKDIEVYTILSPISLLLKNPP